MMTVTGVTEPMQEKSANILDLVNEVFVLVFTYHLYPLTDFMTDVETRGLVGTSLVILTLANIAINLGLVTFKSLKQAYRKL